MHSNVSLAANGSVSVKPICEEPNQARISVVRNDPKACDTSSGIVIISIPPSQRARVGDSNAIPTFRARIETGKRRYRMERRSEVGQNIGKNIFVVPANAGR